MSRRRSWLLVAVYMAAIFVASSIPGTRMPMPGLWRFDKLVHALVFAGLSVLVYRASRRVPVAIAVTTTYGVLDELHQRFTPHRSSDPADVLADFVGACAGAAAASMWVSLRERRSRRTR